jgi:hypothetical protein
MKAKEAYTQKNGIHDSGKHVASDELNFSISKQMLASALRTST